MLLFLIKGYTENVYSCTIQIVNYKLVSNFIWKLYRWTMHYFVVS